jgi:organic radical activating enzyme
MIPALISKGPTGVFLTKTCEKHGNFQSMVERDIRWYDFCRSLGKQKIYDGYFIDVTDKCNLKCKYCFHPKDRGSRSLEGIVNEAREGINFVPFLLTGGEPTLHEGLVDVVKQLSKLGETWVLSNGIKLCDEEYLDSLCSAGLLVDGILRVGLSNHSEANDKVVEFLYLCRDKGIKIGSVQFVIDRLDQIDEILTLYINYRDVIVNVKIKAASNLWKEQSVKNQIFVSDILNYLRSKGRVKLQERVSQKLSYASILFEGLRMNLVSWYEVGNVDLQDINCPPYYKAKDGIIRDFVSSCLINEWIDGEVDGVRVRRAVESDIEEVSKLWFELVMEEDNTNTPNRKAWIEQTRRIINNPDHYLLIAESGNKLIGFQSGDVALEPAINKVCVFGRHFYVKPAYRKGVAAVMLNKLTMQFGLKAGVTDIIRPIAPKLLNFWEEKGCKVTNILIRTGYVGG